MKKHLHLLVVSIIITASALFAQAPEKMNYQAVARNGSGQILANQNLGVRITIHSGTANGPVMYSETHSASTNQFGLFSLAIGDGTPTSGTMGAINWGGNQFFVETAIDPTGGTSYTSLGAAQLLSVPYALYAKSSGQWSQNGNNIYNSNSGRVGIGTMSPTAKLTVLDSSSAPLVMLKKVGKTTSPTEMLKIETDSIRTAADLISLSVPPTAPDNAQFIEFERGAIRVASVNTNGDFYTTGEYHRQATGDANLVPIAYGTVSATGTIHSGSGNFSVTKATTGRYDITISGENFFFSNYIALATRVGGGPGMMSTSSGSGDLFVYSYNSSGAADDNVFSFVVYKP
jgi:hypothetical protein